MKKIVRASSALGVFVFVLTTTFFVALEVPPTFAASETDSFVFDAGTFCYVLSPDARVVSFADSQNVDVLSADVPQPFARLRIAKDSAPVPASEIERTGETLVVSFSVPTSSNVDAARKATFRVVENPRFLTIELISIDGGAWYALEFGLATLKIDYSTPTGLGATTVSAAPGSIPLAMPGESTQLGGKTFSATIESGAKLVLVGAPKSELRSALKHACETAIDSNIMPTSKAGGPWAAETPKNYGNYVIPSATFNVDGAAEQIEHYQKFGIDHFDFHQGAFFRQGDFEFNKDLYPNGSADFRRLTDKLRENGVISGLHTYAEFLHPDSKFVSPIPSRDLDVMASWTLSSDLNVDATELFVAESTAEVSTITGFFVRNSLYLWIDDELIKFGKPSKTAPFGFTECVRGACGTTPAEHKSGATVSQPTHMFGLFAPKAGSALFLEIARETARAYNEGGFETIYLDALDGTYSLVDDPELVWYYDGLFVREIVRNCAVPPLLEYSTMDANLWLYRSRMGAWDSAHRGYRQFFTKHFESNRQSADAAFLPGQIGWLALCPTRGDNLNGFQKQTLFVEDVHYLGAKTAARNYGYSILGMAPGGTNPAEEANGLLLARYDKLRRSGALSDETRRKLVDPAFDVVLVSVPTEAGTAVDRLAPANLVRFDATEENRSFNASNPNAAQVPYIRIENLYGVGAYDASEAVDLIEFDETEAIESLKSATFDPPLDLSQTLALGIMVCGNGKGQKLNVRIESPEHLSNGHTDHFATLDFVGWRFVRFAEAQNGLGGYENWPVGCGSIYSEYREDVKYDAVSKIHIMTLGDLSGLKFKTLKALPIQPYTIANPTFAFGEKTFHFNGEIESGCYLEFDPAIDSSKAFVRNPSGEVVSEAPLFGNATVPSGESTATFSCEKSNETVPLRAKITVRTLGETLDD